MKKLTSIILALAILLSMCVVATASIGATNKAVPEIISTNSSKFEISEFDKENADKISGVIYGYIGDANGDEDISVMDATEIQLAIAQIITLDEVRTLLCDADGDNELSIMDATQIQLYIAKLITSDIINHALYTPANPDYPEYPSEFPNYPSSEFNTINFDTNSAGWDDFKYISCHIWEYGGESFYAWGSKGQRCTDKDGDGIWTYDLDAKGVVLESDKLYAVIFYNDLGMQTYDLLLTTECIGDTAFCSGIYLENLADSNKSSQAAFWSRKDPSVLGPVMGISSIGNVVGTCVPSATTPYKMFVNFLVEVLENARTYSGKDDQHLLDDIAKALGLNREIVHYAINDAGVRVDWNILDSTLEGGPDISGGIAGTITRAQAFDEIKNYLIEHGDPNHCIVYEDYSMFYSVVIAYDENIDAIKIHGYDFSTNRSVSTDIQIKRDDRVFYYESDMTAYIETGAKITYYSATGFATSASTTLDSFYTENSTFSSTLYPTYADAEPTITKSFEKSFTLTDTVLKDKVNCTVYDLLKPDTENN